MMLWMKGGMVYREHRFFKEDILVEDGLIRWVGCGAECGRRLELEDEKITVLDAADRWIVPGFFDIHTHGAVNVDVNRATAEELERVCCYFASCGTTSWLCSILTDTREQTLWCIEQYKKWKQIAHHGAVLEGIHLEGPFLSAEYKGAMPEHLLLEADLSLLKEYQQAAEGGIRYITVSPEVKGILEGIPEIRKMGIQVAIGHSGADYETSVRAIEHGAMGATHVGNAMKLLHQHSPAIFGAVLEDERVYTELICDGRHLHPGTVRFLLKIKGLERVVGITDSIMASGLPDGNYKLGGNPIVVTNGDAALASSGVRAGSTLNMGQAFRNLLKFSRKSLIEMIPVFTENPARLIGMFEQIGSLEIGKRANLIFLDEEFQVVQTVVDGEVVG